jgi:hypothetical protein
MPERGRLELSSLGVLFLLNVLFLPYSLFLQYLLILLFLQCPLSPILTMTAHMNTLFSRRAERFSCLAAMQTLATMLIKEIIF